MRRAGAIICVVAAFAAWGAALAQEAQTQAPAEAAFTPRLMERPPFPGQRQRFYPVQSNAGGAAVLCCKPREDRTLDCRVAWEQPQRRRFGESALVLIADYQMLTAESYADYMARVPGAEFPRSSRFELLPDAPAPPLPSAAERRAMCQAAAP